MPVQMIPLFMCFLALSPAITTIITLSMFLLLVHKIFAQVINYIIGLIILSSYLEMKCSGKCNMMFGTGLGELGHLDDAWQHVACLYCSDLDHHAAIY